VVQLFSARRVGLLLDAQVAASLNQRSNIRAQAANSPEGIPRRDVRRAIMPTEDGGLLDLVDTALVRAIKGAFWFPLVYLPRQLHRAFPLAVKLLRIGILLPVWMLIVFGPLGLLEETDDPVAAAVILAWTVLALTGSVVGVWRFRRPHRAEVRAEKPRNLAEVFA
jgi:hypothetical protein